VIRFDFDERHVFEPPDDQLPWFVRVLIADATFWALFLFIAGPWLALIYLLWPRVPEKPHQVAEERTPIVFMQPQEIPRELLRPRIASPKPTPKPTENITVPGNTKPFEAGEPPAPKPAPPDPPAAELPRPEPETQITRNTTTPPPVPQPGRDEAPRAPAAGVLGRALQNLDRYAQTQAPANPLGGATDDVGGFQFDPKGADFGPWIRRFITQVRRNWLIPLTAQSFRGHVVLQFVVHRDGRITDIHIAQPSDIPSFTQAAYNAIAGSNPTLRLPADYPDEACPFTVTFFYNEEPPR